MQRKVWRYSLKKRETILEIPGLLDILEIGYKETTDETNLWVEVLVPNELVEEDMEIAPELHVAKLSFLQIRTNEPIPEDYYYLKTLESTVEPGFIYHIYLKQLED